MDYSSLSKHDDIMCGISWCLWLFLVGYSWAIAVYIDSKYSSKDFYPSTVMITVAFLMFCVLMMFAI